jgi:L-ascorbate metabolism protein UlaG (beta-lactamase superfamily)
MGVRHDAATFPDWLPLMDMPAHPAQAQRRELRRPRGMRALFRSLRGGPGHPGAPSDHFDGERFFNPDGGEGRSFRDFLKWRRTAQSTPWPQWVENRARPAPPAHVEAGEIALTFVNHITFLIQLPGLNVLTDPVYAERASPFRRVGPKRVRAPGLAFEALPPIHLVLVSHNHYDHLDIDTLVRLENAHRPRVVTGLGNRSFLESFGLTRVDELDWWQGGQVGGAAVTYVPAKHWSARSGRNRNRTLWGGFWLSAGGREIYFAGDTGYGPLFSDIRARCGSPDLALLPIGAYEPRWFMAPQHMDPQEAVRAHLDLGAHVSVGTHFGCFKLTDEGIDDPLVALAAAREREGVAPESFQAMETGETRIFGRSEARSEAHQKTRS